MGFIDVLKRNGFEVFERPLKSDHYTRLVMAVKGGVVAKYVVKTMKYWNMDAYDRIACSVKVPAIVYVGNYEMAYDFIEGQTIRELFDSGDVISLRDAVKKAGREIRRMHNAGFLHGDFHPSNVVYSDGECWIIDLEQVAKLTYGKRLVVDGEQPTGWSDNYPKEDLDTFSHSTLFCDNGRISGEEKQIVEGLLLEGYDEAQEGKANISLPRRQSLVSASHSGASSLPG